MKKSLKIRYPGYVLITGATSGIGERFAQRMAEQGFDLILTGRNEQKLLELQTCLASISNSNIIILAIDIGEKAGIKELIEKVKKYEIGILINNAGFGFSGDFIAQERENIEEMINLNCMTPALLAREILPKMVSRKNGAIIFLGSVVAFQSTPFMGVYSATKSFNNILSGAIWYEYKDFGVDILSLNPGSTRTSFHKTAGIEVAPMSREADQVVSTALKSLGKKPVVVDGTMNSLSVNLGRLLSKRMMINAAGYISKILNRSTPKA
ncbi:MAG: SDR family NAD(P)-dependent oxidoreductase [Ignavibacteriales bacterium]|nr:SDR family NAD(P)-dependent oxidoreductase [Ignavibacteriales bacterium]MCF8435484.1 SDR family NAD(P)-dependent oxidoreductase [Ignavibacteriales bacterium]